jgi:hypothetical protein
MTRKTYIVTGKEGANLRVLPSSLSQLEAHLETGAAVLVVTDISGVNTVGEKTTYLCVEHKGKYLWTAAGNLTVEKDKTAPTASTPAPKPMAEKTTPATAASTQPAAPTPITTKKVNYLTRAADAAKKVYPLSIGKVHSGSDAGKVVSLSSLKKHHSLSCNRMMSITLQEAGLLEKGQIVSHTKKAKGKKTIADAVKNVKALKHCKVIWVNKRYKDLPAEYKKAGVAYIQNSNACISAGGGRIWSCNRSKGYKYRSKTDYFRSSGYPFNSRILVVIVPEH